MSKRKVLVIGSCQGKYGGIEAFMLSIADSVAAWPEFEVRVCFKLTKGAEVSDNLRAQREHYASPISFVRRGSVALLREIGWADVLHVQNVPPDVVGVGKLLGKRMYCTIHNWRRRGRSLHSLLWSISSRLVDRRWYNSRFVMSTWERGAPRVGSEAFPTESTLPTGYVEPAKRKGFLFIGRWIENKGIEELVCAYGGLDVDRSAWPLTIVGTGPIRGAVERLIADQGLEGEVRLPGFVRAAEKDEYLRRTKWLCAPANTREDLGLTPVEARNVGVPSIVTRDGGLPEAGGSAALVAEPGDVASLRGCLEEAVAMGAEEYARRAGLAKESLRTFLKPREFYREAFAK